MQTSATTRPPARSVETGGGVYAFEPDPRSYRALAANVTRNGFENVHLHNAGVAAETGKRTFFLTPMATHSGLHRSMEDAAPKATEASTVGSMTSGHRVDVIKMDIEGGEPAAFEGMSATLALESDRAAVPRIQPSRAQVGRATTLVRSQAPSSRHSSGSSGLTGAQRSGS